MLKNLFKTFIKLLFIVILLFFIYLQLNNIYHRIYIRDFLFYLSIFRTMFLSLILVNIIFRLNIQTSLYHILLNRREFRYFINYCNEVKEDILILRSQCFPTVIIDRKYFLNISTNTIIIISFIILIIGFYFELSIENNNIFKMLIFSYALISIYKIYIDIKYVLPKLNMLMSFWEWVSNFLNKITGYSSIDNISRNGGTFEGEIIDKTASIEANKLALEKAKLAYEDVLKLASESKLAFEQALTSAEKNLAQMTIQFAQLSAEHAEDSLKLYKVAMEQAAMIANIDKRLAKVSSMVDNNSKIFKNYNSQYIKHPLANRALHYTMWGGAGMVASCTCLAGICWMVGEISNYQVESPCVIIGDKLSSILPDEYLVEPKCINNIDKAASVEAEQIKKIDK